MALQGDGSPWLLKKLAGGLVCTRFWSGMGCCGLVCRDNCRRWCKEPGKRLSPLGDGSHGVGSWRWSTLQASLLVDEKDGSPWPEMVQASLLVGGEGVGWR
ncbi:hypothetical protein CRG98_025746 [Punica granatum]|uniref:Uncharacterized protein n=1 Tax=Punica granatum TaxID=22663 RepID=A0A2I0JC78_PUNGR|nr:hypothetical protein CRG98_025746 [Punica granatum]